MDEGGLEQGVQSFQGLLRRIHKRSKQGRLHGLDFRIVNDLVWSVSRVYASSYRKRTSPNRFRLAFAAALICACVSVRVAVRDGNIVGSDCDS